MSTFPRLVTSAAIIWAWAASGSACGRSKPQIDATPGTGGAMTSESGGSTGTASGGGGGSTGTGGGGGGSTGTGGAPAGGSTGRTGGGGGPAGASGGMGGASGDTIVGNRCVTSRPLGCEPTARAQAEKEAIACGRCRQPADAGLLLAFCAVAPRTCGAFTVYAARLAMVADSYHCIYDSASGQLVGGQTCTDYNAYCGGRNFCVVSGDDRVVACLPANEDFPVLSGPFCPSPADGGAGGGQGGSGGGGQPG